MSGGVDWLMAQVLQAAAALAPGLSVLVSFAVLWTLRVRIQRSLDTANSLPLGKPAPETERQLTLDPAPRRPIEWKTLASTASRHRSRLVQLYVWGGIVLAIVLAAVDAAVHNLNPPWAFFRLLFVAICFGAPMIFIIRLLFGRWRPSVLVGRLKPIVVVVLVGLVGVSSEISDEPIRVALVAIPVLALLLHHRIRAMGVLATGFFTVLLTGVFLSLVASVAVMSPSIEARILADPRTTEFVSVIQSSEQDFIRFDFSGLVSSTPAFWAYVKDEMLFVIEKIAVLVFVALLAFATLGWLLFAWIARLYSRKRLSDQWLVIASIWVFFALAVANPRSFPGTLANVVAVTVFAVVVTSLLPRLPRYEVPCVRLLLLRSFSLGERSEKLFQELESLWRSIGSIQLIGATDLALVTLEPHELLACMRGGLRRKFVHREVDVDTRLASFDHERDPDGRFRVNVLFCGGDATWKYAVKRLLTDSDCVLVDVRGFTRHRAGCVFEIRALAESTRGLPVVFLVDQVTDRDFLAETWTAAEAARSTNTPAKGPRYRLVSEQPFDGTVAERIVAEFANA